MGNLGKLRAAGCAASMGRLGGSRSCSALEAHCFEAPSGRGTGAGWAVVPVNGVEGLALSGNRQQQLLQAL